MSDYGPVYGVELIATLPLDGGMRQAMPSRRDLQQVREISERTAAGYEVLLEHYRRLKAVTAEDEILHNKNALMREAVNIATELAGQVMRIMVGGQPIDKTILRHWLDRYFDAVRAIDSPKATSDSSPAHAHDLLCEALEACRLADDAFDMVCDNASDPKAFQQWWDAKDEAQKAIAAVLAKGAAQ